MTAPTTPTWPQARHPQPLFMISTCGTSILTHAISSEDRQLITQYANASAEDIPPTDKQRIDTIIAQATEHFLNTTDDKAQAMSAELSAIDAYLRLFPHRQASATHALLVSSTYQGQKIGEALQTRLTQRGHSTFILPIPDIVTAPLERFQNGLCELVDYCAQQIDRDKQHVVFNVTGGFKSIQGFLQTLGLFYADECISIFENRTDLLRIPRLPARIDADPLIRNNVPLFRRLDRAAVPLSEVGHLPETLLTVIGEEATLSGWGKLMWEQAKDQLYGEKIWDISTHKAQFGPSFLKTCADLTPDRLRILNRRLDDLSAHLEAPQGLNPPSLDFKPLKQSAEVKARHAGMTHEFDAWADLNAKRCMGYFNESKVFVIAKLTNALH